MKRRIPKTQDPLFDAALEVCVEVDREYPYVAIFHLEKDGTYRLFSLTTISRNISRYDGQTYIGKTGWDVDWIERDKEYAFHQSSGGGGLPEVAGGIYWRHPAMTHGVREETARYCDKTFRKRNKTRRIRRIPIDLEGSEDLMRFLEDHGIESDVYFCTICEEYLPDRPESQCQHVWWCDESGFLRGPGSTDETEPCDDAECWACSREKERKR